MNNSDAPSRVVVSGTEWMGSGFGSIESALYQFFTNATNEVTIVAYAVSTATPILFEQLRAMLIRGIRIRCLINRFSEQPQNVQSQLMKLNKDFPNLLLLYSFVPRQNEADLHAKVVVVDRHIALVGSANLSMRGLMGNHELGIVLEGMAAIDISRAVDKLLESPLVCVVIS